ncbi:MAG: KTSC domain-containing protein [Acidimicrobiales bacterium]
MQFGSNARVLTVAFKNGGIYNYYDVPQVVYEQMHAASSKGQFHAQKIKGAYRYTRV